MKAVWMIFYLKDNEMYEHKSYAPDELHTWGSLEAWDEAHYTTEEEAIEVLKESVLDTHDRVIITKVYVKE